MNNEEKELRKNIGKKIKLARNKAEYMQEQLAEKTSLSKQNGQEELGKYYQSAIEAYTYDNPDVFYLSPNKMYLNIETTTKGQNKTYNVYINNGEEANYLNEEFSNKQDINLALEKRRSGNRKTNSYEGL